MVRFVGLICAALLAVTMVTTPAVAQPQSTVPPGFAPSATSWIGDDTGFVLGYGKCGEQQCAALAKTNDGGTTWRALAAPKVPLISVDRRARVHFANARDGIITDGQAMWVTHTGGLNWLRIPIAAAGPNAEIGDLAANDLAFYALIINDNSTRLYAMPLRSTVWAPVPGVQLAGRGGGTVAAQGDRVYVAINLIHEAIAYWTSGDGRTFRPKPAPCTIDGNPELSLARTTVFALCSSNPGRGFMTKELLRANDSGPFQFVGQAPDPGITTDFAAASPSTVAIAAIGAGAAWLHRCTDQATVCDTPFITDELPMVDLAFTSEHNGVVLWGGPLWGGATLYRTHDAGASWTAQSIGAA